MTYPISFNHIGLSVPNLEEAIRFYTEVMGLYVLMPPSTIVRDDSDIGVMCDECFHTTNWTQFRIAHMSTSDGIGFELFEFPNNTPHEKEFQFWRTDLFHFGVQNPDIESMVKKVVEAGGKQLMPVRYYYKGEKPYRMCYVQDPFGIIFEIYSHSYELTYSSGAYEKS